MNLTKSFFLSVILVATISLSLKNMNPNLSPAFSQHIKVIDQLSANNVQIEICEYPTLKGSRNIGSARNVYAANQADMKLKFIRFTLQGTSIKVEPGLLHYMKGHLSVETRSTGGKGIGGFIKGKINAALSGETSYVTEVSGSGQIFLEPSFGHYFMLQLTHEELIADKGIFVASTEGVSAGVAMQKNVSSALFGGEGFFQTKIGGTGLAVLNAPVHLDELIKIDLHEEKLRVDGNFAVLRTASLDFKVEKASRSIYKTYRSGEGFFQTFSGTGSVWLAPTEAVYEYLDKMDKNQNLSSAGKSGSTNNADAIKD